MPGSGSILVVAERTGGRSALRKGFILARHLEARIELFLCDAGAAAELLQLHHQGGAEQARDASLRDSRRYLEALGSSMPADDVEIAIDVACETQAHAGIVRKVLHLRPDLVVKEAGSHEARSSALSYSDWHLTRSCPAPLMFTHGRAWQPVPRFAAAVDVSPGASPGLAGHIARAADRLATGCGATLDFIYCDAGHGHAPALADLAGLAEPGALCGESQVAPPRVHLLEGRPETTLLRFAREQDYDLFLLGALPHPGGIAPIAGRLTERLLEGLTCDCVLVRSGVWPLQSRRIARIHAGEEASVMSAPAASVNVVCPGCHATVRVPAARWSERPRCPRCAATVLRGEPAELDEANFERHLARSEVPLVVDFWAPWCGPCRTMAPEFAAAAREVSKPVQFAKMNVDENPGVAGRLGVRSIPTTVLFAGGREVARESGARAARDIVAWVGAHGE